MQFTKSFLLIFPLIFVVISYNFASLFYTGAKFSDLYGGAYTVGLFEFGYLLAWVQFVLFCFKF